MSPAEGRRAVMRSEDGLATVWTAGAVAALLVLAVVLFWLGAVTVARHRAANAADLAALAAAGQVRSGTEAACSRAGWVADRMGVRIRDCRFDRLDALVRVEADLPGVFGRLGPATARARAGPVARGP